jgi:predicted DNA-binding transcriptional regulator AlpA
MKDRLLTRREAAAVLTISTRTLDRLERNGKAPRKVQISERRIGYPASEIENFLKRKLEGADHV